MCRNWLAEVTSSCVNWAFLKGLSWGFTPSTILVKITYAFVYIVFYFCFSNCDWLYLDIFFYICIWYTKLIKVFPYCVLLTVEWAIYTVIYVINVFAMGVSSSCVLLLVPEEVARCDNETHWAYKRIKSSCSPLLEYLQTDPFMMHYLQLCS